MHNPSPEVAKTIDPCTNRYGVYAASKQLISAQKSELYLPPLRPSSGVATKAYLAWRTRCSLHTSG